MDFGAFMTFAFGLATLIGNMLILCFGILWLVRRTYAPRWVDFLIDNALVLAFGLATISMAGSLAYSEVVGYPACILCWIQRGFMYPLVPLLGFASWLKKRTVVIVSLIFAILGGTVALYQWIKDMAALYAPAGFIKLGCPYVAGLPSCDRIYTLEFGYITIAMLSLNAFLLIIIACIVVLRKKETSVA